MSDPSPAGNKASSRDRRDVVRVAGLPAVRALFATTPERVGRLLFVAELRREIVDLCRYMAAERKPFAEVGAAELARVAGTLLHGGILAVAAPRPVVPFDPVEAAGLTADVPLLVCLDGVADPHNLGTIARTAAFFGLDRLLLSDHPDQIGPSDAAHRIAEGGLERITLFRANGFVSALRRLKPAYRVVGTALERGGPLSELGRDRPIALVLGNESRGVSSGALAACDDVVTLRGSGLVQSLDVSATAAILIHELGQPKASPAEVSGGAGTTARKG